MKKIDFNTFHCANINHSSCTFPKTIRIWPATKPHSHDFFELAYVEKGNAEWVFPEISRKLTIDASEWILIPPGLTHFERFPKSESPQIGWIGFTVDESSVLYAELQKQSLNAFACKQGPNHLQQFFDEILIEYQTTAPLWELKLKLALSALVICLLRSETPKRKTSSFAEFQREDEGHQSIESVIGKAAIFIEHYCESPLTISDIAERYHMSPATFERHFKRQFETSPKNHQLKARIARAKERLSNNLDTVENVAYSCGFHDESHFSRLFKKHTGTSPGIWRKQFLENR